jgi:small subunit ribosomal protein S3
VGQKVHPTGFRVGIIYDWLSKWFADTNYSTLLQGDLVIRRYLEKGMRDAGVSRVEIERNANLITVSIHTAKPGIVIGRGGQKVDELRRELETLTGKRIRVNIQEIRMPELDAHLVARNIADQLERRVAFRRALRQTVARTMGRGAEGCKAMVAGRLGGIEMSRKETTMDGRVPLHTIRADIDFGQAEAHTAFGLIGVKVWIYKGEKLPEKRAQEEPAPSAREPRQTQPEPGAAAATPAPPTQPEPGAAGATPAPPTQPETPATPETIPPAAPEAVAAPEAQPAAEQPPAPASQPPETAAQEPGAQTQERA